MKKIILLFFICSLQLYAVQPKITGAEYFFDTDPGFGVGISLTISESTDLTADFDIDIDALSVGLHYFNLRTMDETGTWSFTNSSFFYKFSNTVRDLPKMTKGEYFFDTDPGVGNGTSFAINNLLNSTNDLDVNINNLAQGLHYFNVRTMDEAGNWSFANSSFFYKMDGAVRDLPPMTKGEYFFDTDPGVGNGTSFEINSLLNSTNDLNVNINNLAVGFHYFNVRTMDNLGNWSFANSSFFYKKAVANNTQANLVKGEYFFDTDPGFGNGISYSINNLQNSTNDLDVNINNLAGGFHYFNVRALDNSGKWSHTNSGFLFKMPAKREKAPIVYSEYFIDTDPGYHQGTELSVVQSHDVTIVQSIDIENTPVGNYKYFIRVMDSEGTWSFLNYADYEIIECPINNLTLSTAEGEELCPNTELDLNFETDFKFEADNVFTAQLSNENGGFNNPVEIGTLTADETGIIPIQMPDYLPNGDDYRVRVKSSNPSYISLINDFDMVLIQPYINITGLSGTQFAEGDDIDVDYSANCFNDGNVYTLQMSNLAGSFSSPTDLGTLTSKVSGKISGVFPAGLTSGTSYKIRVVGTAVHSTDGDVFTDIWQDNIVLAYIDKANRRVVFNNYNFINNYLVNIHEKH
jgi:hypothetical protein